MAAPGIWKQILSDDTRSWNPCGLGVCVCVVLFCAVLSEGRVGVFYSRRHGLAELAK